MIRESVNVFQITIMKAIVFLVNKDVQVAIVVVVCNVYKTTIETLFHKCVSK